LPLSWLSWRTLAVALGVRCGALSSIVGTGLAPVLVPPVPLSWRTLAVALSWHALGLSSEAL